MRKQRSLIIRLLGILFFISCLFVCNFIPAHAAQRWVETYSISSVTTSLYSVHATSVSTVFAVGTGGRVLKSTDSGFTFSSSTVPDANAVWRRVHFPTDSTGYVFGYTTGPNRRIYKTINGGSGWSLSDSAAGESNRGGFAQDASKVWTVGTGSTGRYTTDGSSWSDSSGLAGTVAAVQFAPGSNTGWAVGTGGKAHKSTDGGINYSAQNIADGYIATDLYVFDTNNLVIVGSDEVYKSTSGGSSWSPAGVTGNWNNVDFVNSLYGWMVGGSGSTGQIYKSSSGGSLWSADPAASSITPVNLQSVDMVDENNGWAVGFDQAAVLSKVYKLVTDPTVSPASSYTTSVSAQDIVINGVNFHPTVSVTAPALTINSVTYDSSTQITLNVTTPTAATYSIIVSNPDTGATSSSVTFVAAATGPVLTSVTPVNKTAGSIADLTITGSGFNTSGTTQVRLQQAILGTLTTIPATSVDVVSSTQITCKVDLGGALSNSNWLTTWDLAVINPDDQDAVKEDAFTIDPWSNGPVLSALKFNDDNYDFTTYTTLSRYTLDSWAPPPTVVATLTAGSSSITDPNFAIMVDADRDGTYERIVTPSGITYSPGASIASTTKTVTFILPSPTQLGLTPPFIGSGSFNLAFYAEDLNEVATRGVVYLSNPSEAGIPDIDVVSGPNPIFMDDVISTGAEITLNVYNNSTSDLVGVILTIWNERGQPIYKTAPFDIAAGQRVNKTWDVNDHLVGGVVPPGIYLATVSDGSLYARWKVVVAPPRSP